MVHNLVVRRGKQTVIDGLDLKFVVGSTVLAGENGSGKSTTLLAIATLLKSTGAIEFGGLDLRGSYARHALALLPQDPHGLEHLTVNEAVEFVAVATRQGRDHLSEIIDLVGMGDFAAARIRNLSVGQRRLAYLAVALAQRPEVLLLDEPTAALDAQHRQAVRAVALEVAKHAIVITATHLPDDLDALADRLVILSQGRVVVDGTREEIQRMRSLATGELQSWDTFLTAVDAA